MTPLSLVVTKAGGVATNGTVPILDLKPKYQLNTTVTYLGDADVLTNLLDLVEEDSEEKPTYYP